MQGSQRPVVFLGAADPIQKRPTELYHFFPGSLLTCYNFRDYVPMPAAKSRRLGVGKSSAVYICPVDSDKVLKIAAPGRHGQEADIWRHMPQLFPVTTDCGMHALKLMWANTIDVLVVHVLRANRLRPLDEWFHQPTMDFIYYLASFIGHVARSFNIRDLGWYNFGVVLDLKQALKQMMFLELA